MNLVIDIGNTLAKLVAFDGDEPIDELKTSNDTLEALPFFCQKHNFSHGILGSVYRITDKVEEQLKKLPFPLLRLTSQTPIPIKNLYKTPETLGCDRLAAAIGAYSQYPGRNILIIDAGTCLTYEFINSKGEYLGGFISPGLQMRLKALNMYTASLPFIKDCDNVPPIGFDTTTSICSGVIHGIRYEIEGHIQFFQSKYEHLLVFLTGGDEFHFDSQIKNIIFADKYIVPKGLNRILAYNNELL